MPLSVPVFKKTKKGSIADSISIGLDIGSYAVTAVVLRHRNDIVELVDILHACATVDTSAFLSPLKPILEKAHLHIALGGVGTVLRYVVFPRLNPQELLQSLKFEAQKHIPFPLEQMSMDTHILREDLSESKMLVLLAAVKTEVLQQRLDLLKKADLFPAVVDLEPLSLVNACMHASCFEKSAAHTVASLHVGHTFSMVTIIEKGIPALSRDIPVGGKHITQRLSDLLHVETRQAQTIKDTAPVEHVQVVAQALDGMLVHLAGELRSSFDYYESQNSTSIGTIFISGGVTLMSGFSEKLSSLLGLPVQEWDPFTGIVITAAQREKLTRKMMACAPIALGLALRSQGSP